MFEIINLVVNGQLEFFCYLEKSVHHVSKILVCLAP